MSGPSMTLKKIAIPTSLALAVVLALGTATPGQTSATTAQPPAKAKAAAKGKTAATRLDLNKATAEEFSETLPGVGEVTARKIVAGRPYASVDDLAKAGIPARTIEAIRPHVTVAPAAPKVAPKPATPKAATPKAETPVNVNTATAADLQTLPGIGPASAAAIIAGRPFRTVDDLEKVRGLGPAKVAALRSLVTVAGPVAPPAVPVPATRAATKGAVARAAAPKATTTGRGGLAPGQVVNINTAPKEVLDLLPGIGPVKAQAIIDTRPFKTREDIMKVRGIKEGEFSKIKDLIKVD
jgi:competence protein ComEA